MSNAEYLTSFVAAMQRRYLQAQHARQEMQVNVLAAVPPVPPLIDQLRDLLATLPDAQKERISLPMLLPHLQGKYRDTPHLIHAARAIKQLGYRQVRSWKKTDHGHRYWIKD